MDSELSYLVSNYDIMKKLRSYKKNIKIMLYAELNDIYNILDILPSVSCACFILLKTTQSSGHWTVLCRNNDNIYYMDSYGIAPDGEMKNISANMRYVLHENVKALTRILKSCSQIYNISSNSIQFQAYSPDINTCGKYCTVFAEYILKGMTLKEFCDQMKLLKKKEKVTYDELICLLYE